METLLSLTKQFQRNYLWTRTRWRDSILRLRRASFAIFSSKSFSSQLWTRLNQTTENSSRRSFQKNKENRLSICPLIKRNFTIILNILINWSMSSRNINPLKLLLIRLTTLRFLMKSTRLIIQKTNPLCFIQKRGRIWTSSNLDSIESLSRFKNKRRLDNLSNRMMEWLTSSILKNQEVLLEE